MEAAKIKNLNVDTIIDNCKNGAFIKNTDKDIALEDISRIYEEFFESNSTKEIFDNAYLSSIAIQKNYNF